jgi:hypothetical protein
MVEKAIPEKLNEIERVLLGVRRFLSAMRTEERDVANIFLSEMLDDVSDWDARLAQLQARYNGRGEGDDI